MEQIYTWFCSFTLFILYSLMFNVINSLMNNFLNIQGHWKIFKDNNMFFKNQGQNVFW